MAAFLEREEWGAFSDVMALFGCAACAAIGLTFAVAGKDQGIQFHGWLVLVGSLMAGIYLLGLFERARPHPPRTRATLTASSAPASSPRYCGGLPASLSATSSPGNSPFLRSISISNGRASGAYVRLAYFRRHLRLRRQRADRELLLRGAAHLAARGLPDGGRPGSCSGAISSSSCMAATGYLLGVTQSKEYAEPEWYVDIWLTIVWVVYFLVFVGTLARRREPHIYRGELVLPRLHRHHRHVAYHQQSGGARSPCSARRATCSIPGVQDAMTQWWYGHNAVGFFLTAGFLGMMYYFVPKRADRPVYSYRLSIVHFWSLIFLYIWAGPHHLHYTALPDWAQTLGMTFSIMLWMPSWGGMINGLMTLSGAWDKLRTDPVIRMLVVVRGLLRHVHLRGAADEHQVGQRAVALYRLDHRACAFRRARLGRLHHLRRRLLPRAVAVAPQGALFAAPGRVAFLDRDARHPSLHHLDVGVGHPAGTDVARLRQPRLPRILLRRDGGGDAPVLHHPGDRRPPVPDRRAAHGLQRLAHHSRRRAGRCRGAAAHRRGARASPVPAE